MYDSMSAPVEAASAAAFTGGALMSTAVAPTQGFTEKRTQPWLPVHREYGADCTLCTVTGDDRADER